MTLEALFLLLTGWLGANLLGSDFIWPYYAHGGGLLAFHLIPLVGFLIFVLLPNGKAHHDRKKFGVALLIIGLTVGGAFFRQLSLRGPEGNPRGIHDGAVHVEVAAAKLLSGQNPYTVRYHGTRYQELNPPIPGGPTDNVVLSHFIYPPLTFLLQTPWSWIGNVIGFFPDVRWLMLAALAGVSALIVLTSRDWTKRTLLLLLTAGNPLIWLYVVAGYNDIWVIGVIVAATWAIERKRWWLSGVFFAAALGLKQSAWILLPLYGWYVWLRASGSEKKSVILGGLAGVVVVFLPFLLWNGAALYDDSIRYASGAIPFSYPISGATFQQYLHLFGIVESAWATFPSAWLQLLVWAPLTLFLGWWIRRSPTPDRWLSAAVVLSTAVLLVSRYNNNNYLSGILLLAVAAYAYRRA